MWAPSPYGGLAPGNTPGGKTCELQTREPAWAQRPRWAHSPHQSPAALPGDHVAHQDLGLPASTQIASPGQGPNQNVKPGFSQHAHLFHIITETPKSQFEPL